MAILHKLSFMLVAFFLGVMHPQTPHLLSEKVSKALPRIMVLLFWRIHRSFEWFIANFICEGVNYHLYSLSRGEVWAGAGGLLESPKPFHRLRRSPFPFRAGCRRSRFAYRLYCRKRSEKASPFRRGVSRQTDGEVIGLRQKSVVFRSVNDNFIFRYKKCKKWENSKN